ncbi:peptide chain release factor 1 [Nitzschia inconspicua]|uniref:Peptide chain release factor 1 n=1 Tax=Nitzschia inconspicua TaxID=303405 RepID=A0A9K3KCA7_9STRA|nr:peptide chain release factor 1 [Nitzschia inconspicua]
MVARHKELLQKMEDAPEESFQYGKELASLAQFESLYRKKEELEIEEQSVKDLLEEIGQNEENDDDLQKECRKELEAIEASKAKLAKRIQSAILPKDPDDFQSDAIVEIRAGTGGDEAALFASELRDTYEKTAKAMGWECDVMGESQTDLGGIKETILSISARSRGGMNFYEGEQDDQADESAVPSNLGPYGYFKYESGVHRVQRVPVNDTRIHTSACSVAVLPLQQQDNSSIVELLPMSELKIETMRSSGAGGQHVNTTESAVRITHIPTGITASIQDARSQHQNKDKALKLIAARVHDKLREEEERKNSNLKSSLLGRGDRSERIRTYNYPQDRVTDHRCKHSTHGISKLLSGSSEEGLVTTFFPFLQEIVRDEQLAAIENEEE